jgi:Leucine-rich repeat (LRR) protein
MRLFRMTLVLGFAILRASSSFAMESEDSSAETIFKNLHELLLEQEHLVQEWNNFFAGNPQLQTLKLEKSQIRGTLGLSSLTAQIIGHPNLTALDLSHCGIYGDEWAQAIGQILKRKSITSLDLSHNKIRGTTWINELRDGLLNNTSLKTLNLSSCKISDLTFDRRIGDVLAHNDSLIIDVSGHDPISIACLIIWLKEQNIPERDFNRIIYIPGSDEETKELIDCTDLAAIISSSL